MFIYISIILYSSCRSWPNNIYKRTWLLLGSRLPLYGSLHSLFQDSVPSMSRACHTLQISKLDIRFGPDLLYGHDSGLDGGSKFQGLHSPEVSYSTSIRMIGTMLSRVIRWSSRRQQRGVGRQSVKRTWVKNWASERFAPANFDPKLWGQTCVGGYHIIIYLL